MVTTDRLTDFGSSRQALLFEACAASCSSSRCVGHSSNMATDNPPDIAPNRAKHTEKHISGVSKQCLMALCNLCHNNDDNRYCFSRTLCRTASHHGVCHAGIACGILRDARRC